MPILLSTWTFGQAANQAGWSHITNSVLDAVEQACRHAEADLANPTVGVGGLPDSSGRVSLDAAMMLSPSRRGAVAAIRRHPHPISVARRVMEATPHVLLVGADADDFADNQLFDPARLLTESSRKAWEEWTRSNIARGHHPFAATMANIEELGYGRTPAEGVGGAQQAASRSAHSSQGKPVAGGAIHEANHDTIGVLGLGADGTLAAGCTTSGLAFKLPGRVGDSPLIGQGLYVDPKYGAAVATGHGELVMSVCGTFLAIEQLRQGHAPLDAAVAVLQRIAEHHTLTAHDQVGVIILKPNGDWATASLRPGFRAAVRTQDRDELVPPMWTMFE